MIDPGHPRLSIVRQCELAPISRSSFYRKPTAESEETLRLMHLIDEQFLETPWYGSRQMARHLRRNGWCVGRYRVRRLMTKMGFGADLPAPEDQRTTTAVIYWCSQSLFKYLPQFDEVFPQIVRAVGDCQLAFIQYQKNAHITELSESASIGTSGLEQFLTHAVR